MNTCITLLLTFIIMLTQQATAQDAGGKILSDVALNFTKTEGISYTIALNFKGADRDDTVRFIYSYNILRENSDDFFGGYVTVANHFNTDRFELYDLHNKYTVDKYNRRILMSKDVKHGVFSDVKDELVFREFLHPDLLSTYTGKGYAMEQRADTMINGEACYNILIEKKDIVANKWIAVWYIQKSDLMPIYRKLWRSTGHGYQYQDYFISDYKLGQVSKSDFDIKRYSKKYKAYND